MEQTCNTCHHSHPICGSRITLECHKNAPVLVDRRSLFPIVRLSFTCGEWKPEQVESDETKPAPGVETK